jgi:hypothetical protein
LVCRTRGKESPQDEGEEGGREGRCLGMRGEEKKDRRFPRIPELFPRIPELTKPPGRQMMGWGNLSIQAILLFTEFLARRVGLEPEDVTDVVVC